LVPGDKLGYDILRDESLIRSSPFVRSIDESTKALTYSFRLMMPEWKYALTGAIDFYRLIMQMTHRESSAEILTCTCGDPGCGGFQEEYFHVSEQMVRWSIWKWDEKYDLHFERKSYEMNVIRMLRELVENGGGRDGWCGPYLSFTDHVMWMLGTKPYYQDFWNLSEQIEV
ncbi:MAG: hypothetical protein ACI4QT_04415, partial [Kiritimatiellia bacterium]